MRATEELNPNAGGRARGSDRRFERAAPSTGPPSPIRLTVQVRGRPSAVLGTGEDPLYDEGHVRGALVIVYLVGMPGSGKSTVGPELAARLGVAFVELDAEIERAAGATVRDIFEHEGEARFRELEAGALIEAARRDPSVVSCGGGVVLEPANRITLRATGEVVFLSVPLEVLRERVLPAKDRPLIREAGDLERLQQQREPLYREFAAHVVDASGSVEEVATAIEKELLRWSA